MCEEVAIEIEEVKLGFSKFVFSFNLVALPNGMDES
jgi:hypothetical protein